MVCALIWSLWDGRTGYRRSPSQLVGPMWLLGRPLEPGLLGRGRESCGAPFFFFFSRRRKTKVSDREFDPRWLHSACKSDSIEHGEIAVHVMKC